MNKLAFVKTFKWIGGIALVCLVITGLTSATFNYFEINKQLDIFAHVFREVNVSYVEDTEPGDLMRDAVDNMLRKLDPYTVYIPESDIENYRMMQTGQYGGVGASIIDRGDYVVVTTIREGFPAQQSGMQVGDEIISVEGKSMKGKSTEDVSGILKGSPGTEVEVEIRRDNKMITLRLKREEIQLKSVPYYGMVSENTGYIVLTSFTDKASKEVGEALKDLKNNNNLESLILDLRGNPGGLLSEAVNVTNIFIDKGELVVETKSRLASENKVYKTLRKPIDLAIPVVVLINGSSASASEIVSGTIQDLDRGVVLGQQSFGKGLVQQTKPLSYGSQLKITIAKYYTPSGRCIQAINYADRKKNGSVKRMPDSLRTAYSTRNGRKVLDGAGVDPDILIEKENIPPILASLIANHLVFDYATEYVRKHSTIPQPSEFMIGDSDYNDFIAFLNGKEYDYFTETEKKFNALKEVAAKESYDEISEEIKVLSQKFHSHKNEDLRRFKPQIVKYLEHEIVQRYYYEKGRIIKQLQADTEVVAAIKLLNNNSKYQELLQP